MDLTTFWYWVNERHRIYLKRVAGMEPPWTEDAILHQYRFTNVFRDLDRGTRWCKLNITDLDMSPEEFLLNIVLYRMVNRIDTARLLELPWRLHLFATDRLERVERSCRGQDIQFFTAAHISPLGGVKGVRQAVTWLLKYSPSILSQCRTVESCYEAMLSIPNVGRFLSHQFCQDLRHTPVLAGAPDGETWAKAGPGCVRGLYHCKWYGDHLEGMLKVYETQTDFRQEHVPTLEVKDIQQSMCELQKYVKMKRELTGGPRCKRRIFDTHGRGLL